MRALTFAALLLCAAPARAQLLSHPQATVGVLSGWPDFMGLFASAWLVPTLSVDAEFTLVRAMAGLTGHVPVVEGPRWRHAAAVRAGAGWLHQAAPIANATRRGPVFAAMAGYALLGDFDLRVLAGAQFAPRSHAAVPCPAIELWAGTTWP